MNVLTKKNKNLQLITKWKDSNRRQLITVLEKRKVRHLKKSEILVEVLYVPTHGSFWLAVHPDAIHPRCDEFMRDGSFVFGNGAVGRVIDKSNDVNNIGIGDYVCVYGHYPCNHADCNSCKVQQRYIECQYGEGKIIGHGNGAEDGTFAKYVILPDKSWEKCFSKNENPTHEQMRPFMFAYLVADVRNALTRHQNYYNGKNILLIGGGLSSHIAVSLINRDIPEAKLFILEVDKKKVESIKNISTCPIDSYIIENDDLIQMNNVSLTKKKESRKNWLIKDFESRMREHFEGKKCDFLVDFSSGESSALWFNPMILSPGVICTIFGFGLNQIVLDSELLKLSGLTVQISRGPGNMQNRMEVIKYMKEGGSKFITDNIIDKLKYFSSINEFSEYVDSCLEPTPNHLYSIEHAYFCP